MEQFVTIQDALNIGGKSDPKGKGKRRANFAHPSPWPPRRMMPEPVVVEANLTNPTLWEPVTDGAVTVAENFVDHDAAVNQRSICTYDIEDAERVVRLQCQHLFHGEFFNSYLQQTEGPLGCPNCRGRAVVSARFRYVVPTAEEQQLQSASSATSFTSVTSAFPWNPADDKQPDGYVHAATALASGEHSILADPGAWTNIGGENKFAALGRDATKHGYKVSQRKLEEPLKVQGVGDGTQLGHWEVRCPIAVTVLNEDGEEEVDLFHFEGPAIEGSGADLPLILGAKSMGVKNRYESYRKEKRCLRSRAQGGTKSPGPRGPYGFHWRTPCRSTR